MRTKNSHGVAEEASKAARHDEDVELIGFCHVRRPQVGAHEADKRPEEDERAADDEGQHIEEYAASYHAGIG